MENNNIEKDAQQFVSESEELTPSFPEAKEPNESEKGEHEPQKKSKKLLWSLAFVLIAVLTVWAVTSQNDSFSLPSFIQFLSTLDAKYVILAFLGMLGFIVFEALALRTIAKSFGYKRSITRNFTYSSADIYFSAITPSASGGQPASALFMVQDGIPASMTTVILIVNLVMYTFAIIFIGIICFILDPLIFLNFSTLSQILIIIGCAVQVMIAILFIMLLRHPRILYRICAFFLTILAKMHIVRNLEAKKSSLSNALETYRGYVQQIRGKKWMLIRAFIFNVLQRSSLIFVTLFAFLASGGSPSSALDMWVAQSMVVLGTNTVPIPGAMGISDYMMLDAFGKSGGLSEAFVVNLVLLSRSISFYFCVIICGLTFVIRCLLTKYLNRKVEK